MTPTTAEVGVFGGSGFYSFLEDVEVFSAQQRNLDLMPNPPQTDINADTGVIQARRILDRLHQEEQVTATPMAAAE